MDIRTLVEADIPASCRTPQKMAAIRHGAMSTKRDGLRLYAYFTLDNIRVTAVVPG